mmetsp:Transcript_36724/g.108289  ORF Transcript_36724/g.108289 Transcript_36724/m.108289 type:complete len:489 (-) Transcript_36724:519-1985(-)
MLPDGEESESCVCQYCLQEIDFERDYSTELSCGRAGCGRSPFHQTCIETHLRKLKLPTDRMAGFPCPRGHGKDRTDDSIPCKGRIDSTHKRLPCNLKKKKKALAPVPAPARNGRKDGMTTAASQAAARMATQQSVKAAPTGKHTAAVAKPAAGAVKPAVVAAVKPKKEDIQALVARMRSEINGHANNGGPSRPAPQLPRRPAAPPQPAPGDLVAARLGGAAAPRAFVPGMEPAEPAQRKSKAFNLTDSSFPQLGAMPAKANNAKMVDKDDTKEVDNYNGSPRQALVALPSPAARDVPSHFVRDVNRYNALVGAPGISHDDGGLSSGDSGGGSMSFGGGSICSDIGEPSTITMSDTQSELADPEEYDPVRDGAIPDDQLWVAVQHGLDAAGLDAKHFTFVQQVAFQLGMPFPPKEKATTNLVDTMHETGPPERPSPQEDPYMLFEPVPAIIAPATSKSIEPVSHVAYPMIQTNADEPELVDELLALCGV